MRNIAIVLLLGSLALAACKPAPSPEPEKPMEPKAAQVPLEIPPAEPRPGHLGPSVKWAPESPRYQQVREQAWREGTDFARKVDLATERKSRNGLYTVKVENRPEPTLDEFHAWALRITDAAGKPVEQARVSIKGGMPEHGHGLPTSPKVTATGKPGEYRIEGLQFSMPGWWELSLYISRDKQDDSVTLNLIAG